MDDSTHVLHDLIKSPFGCQVGDDHSFELVGTILGVEILVHPRSLAAHSTSHLVAFGEKSVDDLGGNVAVSSGH